MRQNWPEVPIRSTYLGLFDGPHATPSPVDDGPVFLGIGNLTEDGHLDLNQTKHISEADFPKWTKRIVPMAGDIVFTYEATLNRYAIIPSGFHGCLGRRLALIRPNPEVVDTRWLHYYFFGREWRSVIAANTLSGATVDRIPLTTFPDFPVRLPPLKTQRRIASILSAYDDLIENNTRRIAILEEMARRIYEEWFVRFRFPGHEQVKMVESELGLIPEGWFANRFQNFCLSVEDGDWIETKDQGGNDYRLLQISNVGLNSFVETGNFRYISAETFKKLRCREVLPGHILVARMPKPIGRAWLVTPQDWRMVTAVDVAVVEPNLEKTSPELLLHYLNSEVTLAAFAGQASGTTRLRITRKQIEGMPIVHPNVELAHKFAEMVRPMNNLSAQLQKKNSVLRATRDLLLPKLISGELDVSTLPEPEEAIAA